jgi:hypothetical protein
VSPRKPSRSQPQNPQHDAQLPLALSSKRRAGVEPQQAAKLAVARRARPSALSGHVKLALTIDMSRALAERLTARAIREGKNLEALVAEILETTEKG